LIICRTRGIQWCGRKVKPGAVVVFDFESSGPTIKNNLIRIALRYDVPEPDIPAELEPYLLNDDAHEPLTARLLHALKCGFQGGIELLREVLRGKPNALIIVDPTETLFPIDTTKKPGVNFLFAQYRLLLADYPEAVILGTFNLRKRDRRSPKTPCLLSDPRSWLEEVCGSLDLMNRSDVRLGLDVYDGETKVLNGVRRGEELNPTLIRPVGDSPEDLAGFEVAPSDRRSIRHALTPKQLDYWEKLPSEFRFMEAVEIMGKANFSRLAARLRSLGALGVIGGAYRKLV
jgi:hypothetical protein